MKFKEYKGLDLPQLAADVLAQWDAEDTFHKSISTREGHPAFVFYEGPPSANGLPGIHHVMARTIKDIICRYKTQQGYLVHRKAGWDTHGLPVELGVEKKLGITKEDIGTKISIEEYNRTCREAVMEFTGVWENLTRRMGYWVNMDDPYITYDNKYIETLWWLLKQLFDKGLLYKGYTIQPYSPAAGTGLSTHELNQPGCYRDVKDTTCTAQFRVVRDERSERFFEGVEGELYFLAWTTTPWTLPSNTALAVGPAIDYVRVKCRNPYTDEAQTVILARELVPSYFTKKMEGTFEVEDRVYKGPEFEGVRYEQLLPWVRPMGDAFRVIVGDYVTTTDGTGIVHIAPTFGADDNRVAKQAGIAPLFVIDRAGKEQPMVDRTGKFFRIEELDPAFVERYVDAGKYGEYAGRYVKNAYDDTLAPDAPTLDVDIAVALKGAGMAFKIEKHVHSYPHCWRTDKPVLYYPLDSWFIRTTALRERMIELNRTIRWMPESTGTGRFGKWLEGLVDWNLSRSRFWGTPLPVWATEDYSELKCIGSMEELTAEIERAVAAGVMKENPYKEFRVGDMSKENYAKIDLHRPYVDQIVLVSSKGEPMRRESDLIDVWFDSGAMPYAQQHYPFEHREGFGEVFPADFIAEGVDQTRGWFFTLHAIAAMLFDSVAFKNIISNGLVLDKNGNKMSKRLGNAVDPFEVLDSYGADATRWYMITNSQPWDNLKFDRDGVDEVRRKFFGTLYNTYSFFALYANVDGFTGREAEVPVARRPEIDRWIVSLLNTLVADVTASLEGYDPTPAARMIQEFVCENLSNWYVRLNRKRFWGGGMTEDKLAAYQTLYTCLETVASLSAPFAPFISERIFRDLNAVSGRHEGSVHLAQFPAADPSLADKELEETMSLAQRVSSMVLALRRKVNIKVRQPLGKILIPVLDPAMGRHIEAVRPLIMNEVNVKRIELVAETAGLITKRVKPNFKTLGPKYGKYMKQIAALTAAFTQEQIAAVESAPETTLDLGGERITVTAADFEITSEDMPGWLVTSEGKLTVALDITVTDDLRREGVARELINRIQNIRKDSGFEVTDRIRVEIEAKEAVVGAVAAYADYIGQQTLARDVRTTALPEGEFVVDSEIDEEPLKIAVTKL
ncbi:MAG: isoleucine--tRNA ligase [Alistipes communis]|jgi:isoleucyl-tRNA synthetase|uniref:isoleucine--tRNA ligase n=1 Tax=Alistipes communis TaxID=2585118 RepID=UPI000ED764DA|nr:isoleucine--tRNA ligase [Alistipes communis]BBL13941.1 isoleucine--tRNA ligase [Alistipes communis]HCP59058.1 isoleucine--tRNA ligase [Alistipes communis]